jgi:ribose/xylose/arabinose/galactoside ABC-type transport system permease subunit
MTKRFNLKQFLLNYLVLVAIVLLVIITIIVEPKFLSGENLTNIMRQFGPLSFVSLGMTFVIIGGFIDLSVAGIISLVAVVTVSLIDPLGQIPALIIGIGLGAFLGFLNSMVLISAGALTQAEALFITYGMSAVYSAVALIYTDGATQHMSWLTSNQSVFTAIGSGTVGIVSVSFLVFLVSLGALWVFHNKTYNGRAISYTGGNKVAAELSGIPIKRSVILIYTIRGLMSAIGAVVLFSRITTAAPIIGKNYETNAILSVVVGGTTLKGGKGSVLRTVLGVLLITLMSNCMNLLGVSSYLQVVLKGAILVLAIWLDNRKEL